MAGQKKTGSINRSSNTSKSAKTSAVKRRLKSSTKQQIRKPRFSEKEISFVKKTIAKAPEVEHRRETLEAMKKFDDWDVFFMVWQLGVVDIYKESRPPASMPYYDLGKKLWDNCRKQLREAICGDSDTYKEERTKLKSNTESAIIVLIPLVLSALKLPPEAAGVAIVISLMILKIGLKAFCATAGDLQKLRGKPGQICSATGRYLNIREGELEIVFKGTRFPQGPAESEWLFFEEIAEENQKP